MHAYAGSAPIQGRRYASFRLCNVPMSPRQRGPHHVVTSDLFVEPSDLRSPAQYMSRVVQTSIRKHSGKSIHFLQNSASYYNFANPITLSTIQDGAKLAFAAAHVTRLCRQGDEPSCYTSDALS